jgi:hypothetical protein
MGSVHAVSAGTTRSIEEVSSCLAATNSRCAKLRCSAGAWEAGHIVLNLIESTR